MARHAEVAGAGIGGLAVSTALAQRGWKVRVHEQAAELREIGVGIGLWHNGQRAAESLGILDELNAVSSTLRRWEWRDEKQRILAANPSGLIVLMRTELYKSLLSAAAKAGVEIVTQSRVKGADPAGALILENGKRLEADLVVGADGYSSRVRESLGLTEGIGFVSTGVLGRVVVRRTGEEKEELGGEHWSGPRRVGVMVCGADTVFMFLSGPDSPEEINTQRVDKALWCKHLPHLAHLFNRIPDDFEVHWSRYPRVTCTSWSSGRCAIIGDAAHAVPPTVAQGAGFAMTDAVTLAAAVTRAADVPEALKRWEARERPVIDTTQKVGIFLVLLNKLWPTDLLDFRSDFVRGALATKEAVERMTAAARHPLTLDDALANA